MAFDSAEYLRTLASSVHARIGMFFGPSPSTGLIATANVLNPILEAAPTEYAGPVSIQIQENETGQTISLQFDHWTFQAFSPETIETWMDTIIRLPGYVTPAVVAGTRRFTIESSRGGTRARLSVSEDFRLVKRCDKARSEESSLLVRFELSAVGLAPLTRSNCYLLCGRLRDLSSLRAGLVTALRAPHYGIEHRYHYTDGLQSRCLEELDTDGLFCRVGTCFSIREQRASMKLDLFLATHFELPTSIRTFVNFQPTLGGTHLEGLAAALLELERETESNRPDLRCPLTIFRTNRSKPTKIRLKNGYIGILHVQADAEEVCFAGATKEILIGARFAEFVHKTTASPLKKRWRANETVTKRANGGYETASGRNQ